MKYSCDCGRWYDSTQLVEACQIANHYEPIPPCKWMEDEDGNWFTDCGEGFTFIDGGPTENNMGYCCYCGKTLKPVAFSGDE